MQHRTCSLAIPEGFVQSVFKLQFIVKLDVLCLDKYFICSIHLTLFLLS